MHRPTLILLALLTAPTAFAAPPLTAEAPTRLVTVAGHGEVRAVPDRATVTLGVSAREPTLAAARAAANRVTTALLKVTRDLGIPETDVRSTSVQVNPEYNWTDPKRARELVAYTVQRQLIVALKDIDRLGDLLDRGIGAGANLVGEPTLDSSRRSELERDALARAVTDARANAAVIARTVDASLGAVRQVTVDGVGVPPVMPVARMVAMARMDAGPAPETYQPGELSFGASVTASFDLVPGAAAH